MNKSFEIKDNQAGIRLDKFISENMPDISRSRIKQLIDFGSVLVCGKESKASYIIKEYDKIEIELPEPEPTEVIPQEMDLDIVFEDSDLLIVNKPKGLSVHPGAGHMDGTLVNGLMHHCKDLSGINGVLRPGIVHRIDKDTSGLIIVCKNDNAHQKIAKQLEEHSVTRIYHGIVEGTPKEYEGTIDKPIGRHKTNRKKMACNFDGKRAVTHYRVIESYPHASLVEFKLETGRTHQIRVHMASIGHPLLFDNVYGRMGNADKKLSKMRPELIEHGQVLHAMVIGFVHPSSGEYMEFKADYPEEFSFILNNLK